MKKFNFIICFALCFCLIFFSGCNLEQNAISVTFSDITGAGSKDTTFRVNFQSEKDYEKLGVDIWIKSETNGATFKIKKELENFVMITLENKDTYYSLSKLISEQKGEKFSYTTYKNAVSKSYIISSETKYNLTLKAVVGEISTYKTLLVSPVDVSKEFHLGVKEKQTTKNAWHFIFFPLSFL